MLLETAMGILFASFTVMAVFQFIKKVIIPWLDKQTPLVQQAFVAVLSLLILPLFHSIGINLPPDVHLWTVDILNKALIALGSFGWHSLIKAIQILIKNRTTVRISKIP